MRPGYYSLHLVKSQAEAGRVPASRGVTSTVQASSLSLVECLLSLPKFQGTLSTALDLQLLTWVLGSLLACPPHLWLQGTVATVAPVGLRVCTPGQGWWVPPRWSL